MEISGIGIPTQRSSPPLPPPEKERAVFLWSLKLQQAAPALARISLGLVFLWFGLTQLYSPDGWVSYLPQFLLNLDINPTFFIFLNGTFEVLLSVFLLLGIFVRPVAFLLGAHLGGITFSLGLSALGVRDFGLSFAMIAVSFYGDDFYTLSEFLKRKKFLEGNKILPYLYNSLLIFLAVVILVFSFYTYLMAIETAKAVKLAGGTSATGASTINLPPGEILSLDVLTKHNKKEDCWLLISNKVYNVTDYVTVHPGGVSQIVTRCGTDATTAFNTKGGVGSHSAYASGLLKNYYVGEFSKAITPDGPASENPKKEVAPTTTSTPLKKNTTQTLATNKTTTKTTTSTGITLATLATHKLQSNCWILISGKVYNMTDYIAVHPGGTNQIVKNCGTDATTAFNTKGGGGNTHSNYAKTLLVKYYVGDLSGSVATVVVNQTQADTITPTASFFGLTQGGPISGTSVITISASDESGIASVRFSVDDVFVNSDTVSPYTMSLITTNYLEGVHTITALVTDTKGNATTKTISLVVANQNQNQNTNTSSTLTIATVANHSTQGNCWLLVSGKIYDVTAYISIHPGGTNQIVNNCGKESTTAFNTKGGGGNAHSNYAKTLLANYYVGDLGTVTNPNQTQPQTDTVSPIVSFSSPSDGVTLSGTAYISASASDTGGILSVRFSIDGSVLITNMSAPYSYSLTTANYGNGSHTLTALATDTSGNTSSATVVVTINNQVTGGGTTPTTLTMSEIATHNTQGNCWLLINNKVYNVATYINVHPGGVNQIVNNCGTDSTTAFNTKGGKGSNHSNNAQNLLTGYYVGDLGGTTTGGGTTGGTGGGTGGTTTPTTHAVTVTSTGVISPTSLTIKVRDGVTFTYTNPNDEVILTFSPQPPNNLKIDKERTTVSYTFSQVGTYTYHKTNGGVTTATIIVE